MSVTRETVMQKLLEQIGACTHVNGNPLQIDAFVRAYEALHRTSIAETYSRLGRPFALDSGHALKETE